MPVNLSALEALDRLRAGNVRFVSNVISIDSLARQLDRGALKRSQAPFAIDATMEAVEKGTPPASDNVMSIVERVRPAVEAARLAGGDREVVARAATRINVQMAVQHLRHGTPAIERWVTRDGMMVIGAEYDLESGRVEFIG
jgi:Carbonic anhydrase